MLGRINRIFGVYNNLDISYVTYFISIFDKYNKNKVYRMSLYIS
jgi:hypothetical protein